MHFSVNKTVCYNGQFMPGQDVPVSVFSPGLQYGQGIMEGIRVYDTVDGSYLFKAEAHLERLRKGAAWMKLEIPFSNLRLIQLMERLLTQHQAREGYLRLLAWGEGQAQPGKMQRANLCIMFAQPAAAYPKGAPQLMISSFARCINPGPTMQMKICGSYAMGLMAKGEAVNCGFDDAIMLQMDGFVAGTPGANLFLEKDDVLYTPTVQHTLAGITRQTVLELAHAMSIPVIEKPILPELLFEADAVFLTGTATEIVPVAGINQHIFSLPWEETIGHDIALKFRQITTGRDLALGTFI